MTTDEILEHVRTFADEAHGTQVRKYTGERYIMHPVRVMNMVKPYLPDTEVLAAALLHDVLEDTPVTVDEMGKALIKIMDAERAEKVIRLVIDLTDIFVKKDFPRLNRRARKDKEAARLSAVASEAQSIKYADIIDNVTDIVHQDADFAQTFVREANKLLMAMKDGHPELRRQALAVVESSLKRLSPSAETF